MCHSPFSARQQQTGLTEEKYLLYKSHPAKPITTQPKKPQCPQVGTAETDETGFGGFVTMPLGIFATLVGRESMRQKNAPIKGGKGRDRLRFR
jgi:hypothetical protein